MSALEQSKIGSCPQSCLVGRKIASTRMMSWSLSARITSMFVARVMGIVTDVKGVIVGRR